MGILHQPNNINKKIKRVSRLVVLPDYQGVGLGIKFLQFVANLYNKNGYNFEIKTSAKNLILALKKRREWKCISYGFTHFSESTKIGIGTLRTNCKTASFFYEP